MEKYDIAVYYNVTPGTRGPDSLAIFDRFGSEPRVQNGDRMQYITTIMSVEARNPMHAAERAFAIAGNSPYETHRNFDAGDDVSWDFFEARSMCVGDYLLVGLKGKLVSSLLCLPSGFSPVPEGMTFRLLLASARVTI
jgi:hypothetical protein